MYGYVAHEKCVIATVSMRRAACGAQQQYSRKSKYCFYLFVSDFLLANFQNVCKLCIRKWNCLQIRACLVHTVYITIFIDSYACVCVCVFGINTALVYRIWTVLCVYLLQTWHIHCHVSIFKKALYNLQTNDTHTHIYNTYIQILYKKYGLHKSWKQNNSKMLKFKFSTWFGRTHNGGDICI